jgi:hypothetical protein
MGTVVTSGLQGTLFDRELTPVIELLCDDPVPVFTEAGTHQLYAFWFEALKLKLGTDWVEPAHYRAERIARWPEREVMWEVMEPVHWFDPGTVIGQEEAVLISVIDEVYPELRLADRVSYYRHGMGRTVQMLRSLGVLKDPTPEPAGPTPEPSQPPAAMMTELAALLRRYGY